MLLPQEFWLEVSWKTVGDWEDDHWVATVKGAVLEVEGGKWTVSNGTKVVVQGAAADSTLAKAWAEEHIDRFMVWDAGFRTQVSRYIDDLRTVFSSRAGLLIQGQPASGKTAAACVIAKAVRRRRKSVMFAHVWDVRHSVRNRIMYKDDQTAIAQAREVDFLILDGLDESDADEKILTLTELERLITWRAKHNRVTLITTQMTQQDLRKGKWNKFHLSVQPYLAKMNAPVYQAAIDARIAKIQKIIEED